MAPVRHDYAGVVNFSRVGAAVSCGGATENAALSALRDDGVRTIVNMRLDSEPGADVAQQREAALALGLNYVHLPFSGASPDPAVFDALLEMFANGAHEPVYVHCASANRVGAAWLAKRVLQDGYTIEAATAEARTIGLTNPALEQFALAYIASRTA